VKKRLLAVPAALLLAGCAAGPGPLHNYVGDHWNKNYQENPLVTSVLSVIPVYPFVYWIAWWGDALVPNSVQFWGWDVWEGTGAAYIHDNPKETKVTWYEK
jgi:hypothetical protein